MALRTAIEVKSDNDLLNLNYHDYLKELLAAIPQGSQWWETAYVKKLSAHFENDKVFNSEIAYKNLYEAFFSSLLEDSERLFANKEFDPFIDAIFANPNQALKRTAGVVKSFGVDLLKTDKATKGKIKKHLASRKGSSAQNTYTPSYLGGVRGRVGAMSFTYHPVYTTSLPSIRKYNYQDQSGPRELRFGTQGLYSGYFGTYPGVNPLFKAWLSNLKKKKSNKKIRHIYFNNLGRDRQGYEGGWEKNLTKELEGLELSIDSVAVITLPADKGFMDHNRLKNTTDIVSLADVKEIMVDIALGGGKQKIKDFFISPEVKALLYDNNEREKLEELVENSVKAMGFSDLSELNQAQLMAVYFHFIKYELTNFIIEKLNPDSFNMSCKDAIDRGGVSSAYYNLIKSIKAGNPMTEDEFAEALHAAPLMVKNRLMNHHEEIIRNTLMTFVNASSEPVPDWLKRWLLIQDEAKEDLNNDADVLVDLEEKVPHSLNYSSDSNDLSGEDDPSWEEVQEHDVREYKDHMAISKPEEAERLKPNEMFDFAFSKLLMAAQEVRVICEQKEEVQVEVLEPSESDVYGARIRINDRSVVLMSAGSDDTKRTEKNLGTSPLPDVLKKIRELQKEHPNDTFFVPLAECQPLAKMLGVDRQHWTMLMIQGDECCFFDPCSDYWNSASSYYSLELLKQILTKSDFNLQDNEKVKNINYLDWQKDQVNCGRFSSEIVAQAAKIVFTVGDPKAVKAHLNSQDPKPQARTLVAEFAACRTDRRILGSQSIGNARQLGGFKNKLPLPDILVSAKKSKNVALAHFVRNRGFEKGDGGLEQLQKDILRRGIFFGDKKFPTEKEVSADLIQAMLSCDKETAEHIISAHSQGPMAFIPYVIPNGILQEGFPQIVVGQPTQDGLEIKLINNDGVFNLVCDYKEFPILSMENREIVGFIEGPVSVSYQLMQQGEQWGWQLLAVETTNPDILKILSGELLPEQYILTHYCHLSPLQAITALSSDDWDIVDEDKELELNSKMEVEELKSKIQLLEDTNSSLEQGKIEAEDKIRQLEARLKSIKNELSNSSLEESKDHGDELVQQVRELRINLDKAEKAIEKNKAEITRMSAELQSRGSQLAASYEKNEQREILGLKTQVEKLTSEIKLLEDAKSSLKQGKIEAEDKIRQLEARLESINNELSNPSLEESKDHGDELVQQVRVLHIDLDKAKKAIKESEAKVVSVNAELQSRESQLADNYKKYGRRDEQAIALSKKLRATQIPTWKIVAAGVGAILGLAILSTGIGALVGVVAGVATWAAVTLVVGGGLSAVFWGADVYSAIQGNAKTRQFLVSPNQKPPQALDLEAGDAELFQDRGRKPSSSPSVAPQPLLDASPKANSVGLFAAPPIAQQNFAQRRPPKGRNPSPSPRT